MTTVQSGKAKARRLQQLMAQKILELFPVLFKDDVRSTPMGSQGEDIQLSPAARKLFPYSIECKARKKLGLVHEAYMQASGQNKGEPLVVFKQDRYEPLVLMSLAHFCELMKRVNGK